jgi:hypothetical protein
MQLLLPYEVYNIFFNVENDTTLLKASVIVTVSNIFQVYIWDMDWSLIWVELLKDSTLRQVS